MGSKTAARAVAVAAGVPVVPGMREPIATEVAASDVAAMAAEVGFPILIKAVSGGGGKGMRTVTDPADLPGALRAARSEASSSFGDGSVYIERRIQKPRHIEIQLLGDHYGTVLPCVERECSIQRRHQKVVEESPSMVVTPAIRRQLASAAAAVAKRVGYTNAGTIEFLCDDAGAFFFLEMNTRLQVEHPITELVTLTDLVHWQIRIARGERLDLDPEALLTPRGHAIECRIYAEDPDRDFLPSPGRVSALRAPAGPGIRCDDGGAAAGVEVPIYYDPLIAKLAAWGADRPMSLSRMTRALHEYDVRGISTTIPFFLWLLADADFQAGCFDTTFNDTALALRNGRPFLEVPEASEFSAAAAVALVYRGQTPASSVPAASQPLAATRRSTGCADGGPIRDAHGVAGQRERPRAHGPHRTARRVVPRHG